MIAIEPRPKKLTFTDAQWIVTIQLEQTGNLLGQPVTLRYADAYMAGQPNEVGRLIALAIHQEALRRKQTR